MIPSESLEPPPPPMASPLQLFMYELRKERNSECIQIEVDNAKTPASDSSFDGPSTRDDERSVNALYRPHSMPTMRSRGAFDKTQDPSGGLVGVSRDASESLNLSRINSEHRKRPTSMPTMTLRRQDSASRWEHGCYSSAEAKESMNAAWAGPVAPPPAYPKRRLSAEDHTAIREFQQSSEGYFARGDSVSPVAPPPAHPKRRLSAGDNTALLAFQQSSEGTNASDQLPDYTMALKFVQQRYGAPPPHQQRASSFTTGTSRERVVALPALPKRRASLDETIEDLFDLSEDLFDLNEL
jgi:hypothetical protein